MKCANHPTIEATCRRGANALCDDCQAKGFAGTNRAGNFAENRDEYHREAAAAPPFMSTDSNVRKGMPVFTGALKYFPDALLCVSFVSRAAGGKHHPGQPTHWEKGKSGDEPDALVRHLLDHARGLPPDPGLEPLGDLGHLASAAWRALALLQRACDAARERASGPVGSPGPYSDTGPPDIYGDRTRVTRHG